MKLTKSEYMQGRSCTTKIIHARAHMPTRSDNDPFQRELSAVGDIVHWLAPQLLNGAKYGYRLADILPHAYGTYAEVEVESARRYARVDLLRYTEKSIFIMEVKSEKLPISDTTGEFLHSVTTRGTISAKWRDLLDDLTFQYVVVLEQLAAAGIDVSTGIPEVRAELLLINPWRESTDNDLRQQFDVDPETRRVTFKGDLDALLHTEVLIPVDVTEIIHEFTLRKVYEESNRMIAELHAEHAPVLAKRCASCEYRVPAPLDAETGFNRCWGALAAQTPFVLNLTEAGRLKDINDEDAVTALTNTGSARMTDLPSDILWTSYNHRQQRQILAASTQSVLLDTELQAILSSHEYPRVCIDVEAVASAFPYWPSTLPYEVTTFQWSAHRIVDATFAMEHREWLHESREHPCMAFLRSIRAELVDAATIYIWSGYERTAIGTARTIATRLGIIDEDMNQWVDWFLDADNPRVVDLLDLARRYYMHPDLNASHSIKAVLPTIWNFDQDVRAMFPEYIKIQDGKLLSPYAALPRLDEVADLPDVTNGTAAIGAYAALVHPTRLTEDQRKQVRSALLDYCKLDTAAMVMIMKGWM